MIWFVVSHSILARWKNHFCQLLNVHGVNDVRQSEIHTGEPLVTEPSAFEFDLAIELLKSHKSPGIDQILAELVKTVGKTVYYEIHKLIISIWNKEELPEEWKESILPLYKRGDKTDHTSYKGISLLPATYKTFIQHPAVNVNSICRGNYWDHQCGFRCNRSVADHVFCICQLLEKKWEYNEAVNWLFIDFKKAYDLGRRDVLYNILIEFDIPMKVVMVIKMCLIETQSRVWGREEFV
jgi:hypothetical protein